MTPHASGDWVSYSNYAALLKELEAKIALLEVQLKLSEAAERAWESSMMQACGEDGPKSVADKFAELESKLETALRECRSAGITIDNLEAKCAALAAENALLKDAISSHAAGFTVCEACGEENISGNDDVCRALNETPVTDAFLAEVRAQGVDVAIEHLINKFEGTGRIGVPVMALDWLAQELRKGVQS